MKYIETLKWLSVILIIAVMIPMIGCGNGGNQEPSPTLPPTATPSEPTGETGTLSDLEGDVQVQRQGVGAWIAATSGMKIGTGDSLKTGEDGYVLITFFDGSVMEIEADTEISVEELSVASGGSTTVRINQVIGSTLNRVENLIDSSSKYEVETLAGTAVVRGTIFYNVVEREDGITHTCASTFKEEEGRHFVDFSNNGETVEIPEGKTACCWQGGVPGNPFYTDPDDSPAGSQGGGGGGCYGYGCHGYPTPTSTAMMECSPGCYYYMIGNSYCDEACYTEACSYDYGDCVD
ncbi:MAG: FecR domain-containing protein [Dehalococcoidia bacterium]